MTEGTTVPVKAGPKKIDSIYDNVITGTDYFEKVSDSADALVAFLKEFCGPFASNVVIPSKVNAATIIDQYTKDGIDIASVLTTTDAASEYLARLATYIGTRVNDRCHDGTTTSMLMFTALTTNTLRRASDIWRGEDWVNQHLAGDAPSSTLQKFSHEIGETLSRLRAVIDNNRHTVQSIHRVLKRNHKKLTVDEVRFQLAYRQALVASKGDHDVAHAVATVLSGLPEELYGQYIVKNTHYETEERFVLEVQKEDVSFNSFMNINENNHELNTEMVYDECDIIVCASSKLAKHHPETNAIEAILAPDARGSAGITKGADHIERTTILVTAQNIDGWLMDQVNNWNQLNPTRRVIPITVAVTARLATSYTTGIAALAGKKTAFDAVSDGNIADAFIRKARIEHRGNVAFLYNMYARKEGVRYHPLYRKADANPYYTKTLKSISKLITDTVDKHVKKLTDAELNEVIYLYRCMACQSPVDIRLSGSTHSQVADKSVVVDAMGAAVSALSDGVVFGGYNLIHAHLISQKSKTDADMVVLYALSTVLSAVYRTDYTTNRSEIFDFVSSLKVGRKPKPWTKSLVPGSFRGTVYLPKDESMTISDLDTKFGADMFVTECRNKGVMHLIQPAAGYYEQFKRFTDIIPKLANSTSLINMRG